MNFLSRITAAAIMGLAGAVAFAQAPAASADEGLVPVKSRNLDKVWLLPGADFRPYRKVLLAKAEVAFQQRWLRDMNSDRLGLTTRVTEADALKIVEAARAGFDQVWAEAFKSAGFEVVSAAGEGVLQVTPSVVNLYVNAPAAASVATHTFTVEAGEATLKVDFRDSRIGTLLGRVADRRETMRSGRAQMTSAVTNRTEFGHLFANWATIAAKGLKELQAKSPVPEAPKPGQKPAPR